MLSLPQITGPTPEARNAQRDTFLTDALTDMEDRLRLMAEAIAALRNGANDPTLFGGADGINPDLCRARADYIARDLSLALSGQRDLTDSALIATALAAGYEPTIA